MPKYKRRSVIIDAFQWVKYDPETNPKWFTEAQLKGKDQPGACLIVNNNLVKILTRDGIMTAYLNDFIIRTEKGDIYPCNPKVFNLLHDIVEEKSDE